LSFYINFSLKLDLNPNPELGLKLEIHQGHALQPKHLNQPIKNIRIYPIYAGKRGE
jgi:hypothetical protein